MITLDNFVKFEKKNNCIKKSNKYILQDFSFRVL